MSKTPRLAVIGLGFIGLPLSLSYAMKGASVIGIDVLEDHVNDINAAKCHFHEQYQGKSLAEILSEQLAQGRFQATTSYEQAANEVDHYIITVGLPVHNQDPDLRYLNAACETLATVLKKGDTVVVRSTVIPGTTEDIVLPLLEKSGLKAGVDFYLAYSSERIAEGRAFEEFIHMPLAVGGVTDESAQRAKQLLSFVTEAEITVSEIKIVETAKVIENIQRDVNIAMVQEFARFSEKLGIDTFELIRIANTHKRVNLLTPGPGVGGYCLPNALYYLLTKAKELQVPVPLLETARKTNDQVPQVLVEMLQEKLEEVGKSLASSKIAVLGLAMKDFSNDDRISPPHHFVQLLLDSGADVSAYDPAVKAAYPYRVSSLEEAVTKADALVYVTVQEEFLEIDWLALSEKMASQPVFLDAKNRVPKTVNQYGNLIRI
ncbi:nucleotide sugar dehydrogenase [Anaerobacillus sp. CMMVII]|nr:nucleotide sugar dehydrogenase [Anaerobacillus sp. CMMVII]